jgi:hypothetical protein
MRRVTLTVLSFVLASVTSEASHIQTSTIGQGRASGVRTDSAAPLEAGQWSFGANVEHSDYDRLTDAELLALREADPEGSLHSVESIVSFGVDASYGLTGNLTVGLHLPYIVRNDVAEAEHEHEEPDAARVGPLAVHAEGIEALGKSSGLGDVSAYGLWRFYNDAATDTNLSLIGGIKMPTGADDRVADTGERFEPEFQPGSGSWDPFAGIAWSRSLGHFNVAASTGYMLATEGARDTDLGDQWTYNAAGGYRLGEADGTSWNLVLELNGGWRDREEANGVTEANSGGTWLFVSPGLNISGNRWSVYASWGYPIDDELNGNQDDLASRILVGFQFLR